MSHIPTPATIADAAAASRPLLEGVQKAVGAVPNGYRLVATSPAALEGLLSLGGALGKGALDPATRERIALAVAEINGCDYCLAAHSFVGKRVAKLDDAEIAANRNGGSTDPRAATAVRFAAELVRQRGQMPAAAVEAVRAAGYGDAEILEIIGHVALNTFTNYVNEAFETEVDFPAVPARKAA
jgi:uncharacterized peroxidase-related enzyme